MASVDSLLRLVINRNAQALELRAGDIPRLTRGDSVDSLSMPPLPEALVRGFLEDVGGGSCTTYSLPDGQTFRVIVEEETPSLRFYLGKHDTAPAAPASPRVQISSPAQGRDFDVSEKLDALLSHASSLQASDVFLVGGAPVWLRVHGEMQELDAHMAQHEILKALDVDGRHLQQVGSVDVARTLNGVRYRVHVFEREGGVSAALRPIASRVPTLRSLHLPEGLASLVEYPNGLVLVGGTAGSGKSTTLAALVTELAERACKHIITLEDPIEYRYPVLRSLIQQRELGTHVTGFADGLRAAMRESPDVILVGELRDRETMAAAIRAAETGHLVLGTIHAGDAVSTVDRVIDVFPPNQQGQIRCQLACVLRATLTQELLPAKVMARRAPAIELMKVTHAVATYIREGRTEQIPSAIQTGARDGMLTKEGHLAAQVRRGVFERSVARARAWDTELFEHQLR